MYLDTQILWGALLALARLSPIFFGSALGGIFGAAPMMARLVVSILLVWVSIPYISVGEIEFDAVWLVLAMAREFFIGLLLIVGIQVFLGALTFAGGIVDMQMGLGAASVFNPLTNSSNLLISQLFMWLGIVAILVFNVHHWLIEGYVFSLQKMPVGQMSLIIPMKGIITLFSAQFALAISLVAPVISGLFCLDLAIGFLSRTMPQMNVYFVTLPLKIFIGLLLLVLSFRYMAPVITRQVDALTSGFF